MHQPFALNVLSYNIHKGFSALSNRLTLKFLKNSLDVTGSDLVFLQEVVGENRRHADTHKEWPKGSQFEYLADQQWPHYAYGRNSVYDFGHHGNAILSRYPIRAFENIDISGGILDRRGILHAVIAPPELEDQTEVHCLCTHLGLTSKLRRRQLLLIAERITRHVPPEAPLILAGDFNDWRGEATHFFKKTLELSEVFVTATGRHVRTFPAHFPLFRLDRIYVRGMTPRTVAAFTGKPWRAISDHIALFAQLELER